MRAGPKGTVRVAPLDFSSLSPDRAERREDFITAFLITPRGVGAKEPFNLRSFQREMIRGAFGSRPKVGVKAPVGSQLRG